MDSNVLLNLFGGYGSRSEGKAAQRFMKTIEEGKAGGVVSTWALMEIITVIRKAMARNGKMDLGDIEPAVERIVSAIYRIRNLRIVSGTPLEMSKISRGPPLLWEILENALSHLSDSLYDVEWHKMKKIHEVNGIGSNDALHIMLAVQFGCDFLATFDRGFWADERPIPIFDVKENRER